MGVGGTRRPSTEPSPWLATRPIVSGFGDDVDRQSVHPLSAVGFERVYDLPVDWNVIDCCSRVPSAVHATLPLTPVFARHRQPLRPPSSFVCPPPRDDAVTNHSCGGAPPGGTPPAAPKNHARHRTHPGSLANACAARSLVRLPYPTLPPPTTGLGSIGAPSRLVGDGRCPGGGHAGSRGVTRPWIDLDLGSTVTRLDRNSTVTRFDLTRLDRDSTLT